MNPVSHLTMAAAIAAVVQPTASREYYWGAIAPDARYLAGLPRQQTHFEYARLAELRRQYPEWTSFLQGYWVHLLCDEIDLGLVLSRRFPFSLRKRALSQQQAAILMEYFFLDTETQRPVFTGEANAVLAALGVAAEPAERFARVIQEYVSTPNPEDRLTLLIRMAGLQDDPRVEKYRKIADQFQHDRARRALIFWSIRLGGVRGELGRYVAGRYQESWV